MFSTWIIVLMTVQMSIVIESRGHPVNGLVVILLYVLGFSTAGMITGLMLPLCRWVVGAALVGLIATLPIGFGTLMIIAGPEIFGAVHLVIAFGIAILIGIPVAVFVRANPYRG